MNNSGTSVDNDVSTIFDSFLECCEANADADAATGENRIFEDQKSP